MRTKKLNPIWEWHRIASKKISLLLFCSLCFGMQVLAQSKETRFNISVKKATINVVFNKIEAQSNYRFFYLQSIINKAKPVSIELKNADIKTVLDAAFQDQPLDYKIENHSILIRSKSDDPKSSVTSDTTKTISGRVVIANDGTPLNGVNIKVLGSKGNSITDVNGNFSIQAHDGSILEFSYIGFESKQTIINTKIKSTFQIELDRLDGVLEEVSVVSSGYQPIPKERATGSFDFVDNKIFNRAVSTDLLSRLNGVSNGLLFSNNTGNAMGISIRGRSTLFSNTQPLIVLDNFPFEGDINDINPNDVESITLLKDAAAASIWGTRAGNGVLVITTKRGKQNRATKININSNITVTGKPDLHYQPRMSAVDYIDVERFLFGKGYYNSAINRRFTEISPVVSILNQHRAGLISEAEANAQIDELSHFDVLSDMEKYLYQNGVNQQYQINVSGGTAQHSYYLAAGYDKNLSTTVGTKYERYTLKVNNTFYGLQKRLQVSTDLNFAASQNNSLGGGINNAKYPYLRLADENGNALEVNTNSTLNPAYTDTVGGGLLLDWKYRPLDEIRNRTVQNKSNLNSLIVNLNLSYKILNPLTISLYYQYNKSVVTASTLYDETAYYTRNQINSFSQVNRQNGTVLRPIPLGGILNSTNTNSDGNYGRVQLNYEQKWNRNHVTAIGGYEARSLEGVYQGFGNQFGYNQANESYQTIIDQVTLFPNYYSGSTSAIYIGGSRSTSVNRGISYYSNIGYVFDQRLLASFSFRKDKSNLFGVDANQRAVPLWSAGLGWNLHKEKFYNIASIPYLKIRLTYGYNGNIDNTTSAYLTAKRDRNNLWQNPINSIVNPPNPGLQWERVQNFNVGLDFSSKDNRLSGSIEYYSKNGKDLMGYSPVAPQTGVSQFYGNVANTTTKGFDIKLSHKNILGKMFNWETSLILNLNKDKVTDYKVNPGVNEDILSQLGKIVPIVGKPIYGMVSYRYGGLSADGNPIGYVDGKPSEDYTAMINSLNQNNLVFHGSRVPTRFGSLRNTFRYKAFEFSFTILYKGGYYFRRQSFASNNVIGGTWLGFNDYGDRWQNPGDEANTQVPKFLYPYNINRDLFYKNSSYLIENGSHIRLQDIEFNYQILNRIRGKRIFSDANFYVYASNLGILWRANKQGLDPDVASGVPRGMQISTGLKLGL